MAKAKKREPAEASVGKRYGRLTVKSVYTVKRSIGSRTIARCKCSCGKLYEGDISRLRSNAVRSCGCLRASTLKRKAKYRHKGLVGRKFNRLTIIAVRRVKRQSTLKVDAVADCLCVCGASYKVAVYHLKSGHIKSCGCVKAETCKATARAKMITARSKQLAKGLKIFNQLSTERQVRSKLMSWISKSASSRSGRKPLITASSQDLDLLFPLNPRTKPIWPWDDLGNPLPLNAKGKPIKQKKATAKC